MENSGLLLPWESPDKHEREFLSGIREICRGHADWLRFYLLDETELIPELTFTRKVNMKIFAERTMSFYRLAQEVYLKSSIAKEFNLEPLVWTARIEINEAYNKLKNSYWKPIKNPIGKVEGYRVIKQYYDELEDSLRNVIDQDLLFVNEDEIKIPINAEINFFQLLEIEANRIARYELDFRINVLNQYYKEQKRFSAQLKNNPKLQKIYMTSQGFLKVIGNGSRGCAKSSKGFK
jgi:hypothetical protein